MRRNVQHERHSVEFEDPVERLGDGTQECILRKAADDRVVDFEERARTLLLFRSASATRWPMSRRVAS
jgi:hypothetical protein